ncbi:MAG: carboxylating nicotinate-nucleotide diphosphorylase [Thaumarchaeota archaeon]|nr:carboxylating nicotinate-nucleotide diphosphorylase [Nitrososphaerota archaeon]
MSNPLLKETLLKFVEEDAPWGDLTTELTINPETEAKGKILAKASGVFAGTEEVETLASLLNLKTRMKIRDGERFEANTILGEIIGKAKNILLIERTLLNLLSHMCSIATATRAATDLIKSKGLQTRIAATRKTHPGLRLFEKKAVKIGGGDTHRMDLSSMVLIKDNHINLCGSVGEAVKRARAVSSFTTKIEVEVRSLAEALEAAEAGADIIMLDNMPLEGVKEVVEEFERRGLRNRVLLEASGGINQTNFLDYAQAGVDVISMGSLTISPQPLDISLEVEPYKGEEDA